jgi:hypothetical protein
VKRLGEGDEYAATAYTQHGILYPLQFEGYELHEDIGTQLGMMLAGHTDNPLDYAYNRLFVIRNLSFSHAMHVSMTLEGCVPRKNGECAHEFSVITPEAVAKVEFPESFDAEETIILKPQTNKVISMKDYMFSYAPSVPSLCVSNVRRHV